MPTMPSNTIRIAKNTLTLYFRQILTMLVSLYTARQVLAALGVENYGIYNVVAGVVVLCSFLNGAMISGTQRFLNYYLAKDDIKTARDVFSISFIIYFLLSIFIILLSETIGLWFFNSKLNISEGRRTSALITYQIAILSTIINILHIPYNATIIAYEKLSFFALLSIFESILKLAVAFLLRLALFDVLICYAVLNCIVGIIIFFFYKIFCNKTFLVSRFIFCKNKILFKKICGFSGWSTLGSFANAISTQGANVLLNIFSGTAANAAMGIATQINTAVYQFVGNFQTSFNPQIIKLYARKEYDDFIDLVLRASKLSYFLLFIFALPLYINIDMVLYYWLKNVPEYTAAFTRLIIIFLLIDAISGPLWVSVQAAGNIKKYQIVVSCLIFSNLPISWGFLRFGYSAVSVLVVRVMVNAITAIFRIFYLKNKIKLPVSRFFYHVVLPIIAITCISGFLTAYLHSKTAGLKGFFITCLCSVISNLVLFYFIGLNANERSWLKKRMAFKALKT
ncbi:MAG: hypothetical protein LBD09_01680 [Treponema sp.]|jgi:O-antigen/teichoic acid export membrane protein|nr:hypothetical protein [Treponema sp.]